MWKFVVNPLYWPIWCVLFLFFVVAHLPFRFQLFLGYCLGKLIWIFSHSLKKVAKKNLELAFPEMTHKERRRLLKKNIKSLGVFFFELGMSLYAPDRKLRKRFNLHNHENLKEALNQGGVILMCPHFMCVELIGRMYSLNHDLAVVYRPQKIKFLNYLNQSKLLKFYKRSIPKNDIRGMIKALRDGLPMFYTPDIDAGRKNSEFVPFFGKDAATVTATPKLARLGRASVVPCYFYRRDDHSGYDIYFEKALENYPSDDEYHDLLRVNQSLEKMIMKKPGQYIWQYRRYKTRPKGEKRFYD